MGTSSIAVLIADAQSLTAESLAIALGTFPGYEVFAGRPNKALDVVNLAAKVKPDVILLDYWMDAEGPVSVRMILDKAPESKIIVLSWFHGQKEIENILEAGAVGFLPRSVSMAEVTEAIRLAHAGVSPVYRSQLEGLMKRLDKKDNLAAGAVPGSEMAAVDKAIKVQLGLI